MAVPDAVDLAVQSAFMGHDADPAHLTHAVTATTDIGTCSGTIDRERRPRRGRWNSRSLWQSKPNEADSSREACASAAPLADAHWHDGRGGASARSAAQVLARQGYRNVEVYVGNGARERRHQRRRQSSRLTRGARSVPSRPSRRLAATVT